MIAEAPWEAPAAVRIESRHMAGRKNDIAELDAWLKQGGFVRAKRPYGALKRARDQRDARLNELVATAKAPTPVPAKKEPFAQGIQTLRPDGWDFSGVAAGFSTRSGGKSTAF